MTRAQPITEPDPGSDSALSAHIDAQHRSLPDAADPGRLMVITLLAVFGLEAGVMAVLRGLPPLEPGPEALIDSAVLSVLVLPVLYLAAYRPLLQLITALETSESELLTSRALLTEAQRVARFGHWEWQPGADRLRLSDEAARILGLAEHSDPAELGTLLGVVHPDDRERIQRVIAEVERSGGTRSCEHRVVAGDGSERMADTQVEGLADESGDTTRVIGVVHDITQRWRALRELERARVELDQRVRDRTADLEAANRELERERAFSNAVIDTSGALIIILDRNGRIVRFNQACERITGYGAAEVLGRPFHELLLPVEERDEVMRVFRNLTAGDIPGAHQNHWLTRDGQRRFISWANTAMVDTAGNVEFVIGTGLDMTDRRRAEEALRESEERLRTILQTAQDGFWALDAEGRIVDVNASYCSLVGYRRSELVGASISLVEAQEDPATTERHVERVLARGNDRFETSHRCKDGRLVDLEVSVTYLPFAGGQMFAFLRDVTESKRNAAELDRRRAELEAIINSNADAIVFTDTERRIAMVNPAFTSMFGYGPDQVRGRSTKILDVDERPDADGPGAEGGSDSGADPHRGPFEIRCRRKDGSTLWVEVQAVHVRDARGSLLGHVGVYRDVSERREAAETIRASLREKEVLLKEIHHRVKNNLQVIASLLNLQSDYLTDPAATTLLQESQNRIRSLALIHEKLYRSRDLARIEFQEYVADLAESIVTSVGRHAAGIRISLEVEEIALGVDIAIPVALIVNELLSNSLKHAFPADAGGRMEAEGQVKVVVAREKDGGLLVAVEDDGVGLPDSLDVHNAPTLGLQLVEVLAVQLGGRLEVASAAGARFEVRFQPEPEHHLERAG